MTNHYLGFAMELVEDVVAQRTELDRHAPPPGHLPEPQIVHHTVPHLGSRSPDPGIVLVDGDRTILLWQDLMPGLSRGGDLAAPDLRPLESRN